MQSRMLERTPGWRSLLPSSFASILLHVLAFVMATWSFRGCQHSMPGDPGGDLFRDVGLFVVDGGETGATAGTAADTAAGQAATEAPPSETTSDAAQTTEMQPQEPVVPREAPRLSELLQNANPLDQGDGADQSSQLPAVIGPGAPLSGMTAGGGAAAALIPPPGASGMQAAGAAVVGPGQTAFMNIADTGRSFVYVIDVSGSMGEDNRLELARSQLKASLRLLQPTQEFQVIFYSESPMRMKLRGQARRPMYYATAANLLLANREIDVQQPQQGTQHRPALMEALSLKPDVVYFLTDGREPPLYPADLNDIRHVTGRTTIHVIEFSPPGLSERSG